MCVYQLSELYILTKKYLCYTISGPADTKDVRGIYVLDSLDEQEGIINKLQAAATRLHQDYFREKLASHLRGRQHLPDIY